LNAAAGTTIFPLFRAKVPETDVKENQKTRKNRRVRRVKEGQGARDEGDEMSG